MTLGIRVCQLFQSVFTKTEVIYLRKTIVIKLRKTVFCNYFFSTQYMCFHFVLILVGLVYRYAFKLFKTSVEEKKKRILNLSVPLF